MRPRRAPTINFSTRGRLARKRHAKPAPSATIAKAAITNPMGKLGGSDLLATRSLPLRCEGADFPLFLLLERIA